jgi:hypothetical protein
MVFRQVLYPDGKDSFFAPGVTSSEMIVPELSSKRAAAMSGMVSSFERNVARHKRTWITSGVLPFFTCV